MAMMLEKLPEFMDDDTRLVQGCCVLLFFSLYM